MMSILLITVLECVSLVLYDLNGIQETHIVI